MAIRRLNFTKDALNRAPLPAHGDRDTYQDAKTPGLQLRVTSSGIKTFSLFRWVKASSRPQRITLGKFPAMTIEQARVRAGSLNSEIEHGNDPAAMARTRRGEMTLGELFEEYMAKHIAPKRKRPTEVRDLFERYLGVLPDQERKKRGKQRKKSAGSVNWQHRKISSITIDEVNRMHVSIGKHSGHVSANHAVNLLRAMYNKAIGWGLFTKPNPAAKIEKFPTETRDRTLQPGEFPKFYKALEVEENKDARDFILLCLLTGARRQNVCAMRWAEIDFNAKTWRIPGEKTKTSGTYLLPLVPEAVRILNERKANEEAKGRAKAAAEWVFPTDRSKSGHIEDPRKPWTRIRAAAKLEDFRLHDLRRTLGSWQAATGASLLVIGKSLGHKDQKSTEVYARLNIDPIRNAMQKAAGAMMVASGARPTAEITPIKGKVRKARR